MADEHLTGITVKCIYSRVVTLQVIQLLVLLPEI